MKGDRKPWRGQASRGKAAFVMTRETVHDDGDDILLVEAADWLVRMMACETTDDDVRALEAWRARSAAHEAAFREVAGVRSYAVVATRTRRPTNRRALLVSGGGALAVLAGFAIGRPPLGMWPSYEELLADHRTPVGGRLSLTPAQGVSVELSSRTSVSSFGSGAGIRLISGEIYVAALKTGNVFGIKAADLRISARAAEFDVQVLGGQARVACVVGEVQCKALGRSMTLAADQALSLEANGALRRAEVNAANETAWRRGVLVFEGTPLGEVIDQINLHRSGRVVLTDRSLAKVPLNAVFHVAQIENAVPQIQQLMGVRARHLAGGVVLLG